MIDSAIGKVKGAIHESKSGSRLENLKVASKALADLPKATWDRPSGRVDVAALELLLRSGMNMFGSSEGLKSSAEIDTLKPVALTKSTFRDTTVYAAAPAESNEMPSVAMFTMYFVDENYVVFSTGKSSRYEVVDGNLCLKDFSGGGLCFSAKQDDEGQAYLVNRSGIAYRVLVFLQKDPLGVGLAYDLAVQKSRGRSRVAGDRTLRISHCVDSDRSSRDAVRSSQGRQSGQLSEAASESRAAFDCSMMDSVISSALESAGGPEVFKSNKLSYLNKMINLLALDTRWDRQSADLFAYENAYFSSGVATGKPRVDRKRTKNGNRLAWTEDSSVAWSLLARRPIDGHESAIESNEVEQVIPSKEKACGRTYIALAPDFTSDRSVKFVGYRFHLTDNCSAIDGDGGTGAYDSGNGRLSIGRGKDVERFSFMRSGRGIPYMKIESGGNSGLLLRIVTIFGGDPLGLGGIRRPMASR
ncbi:hypothetical protein [Sphaerotilus microaerophilus]|uniref:hypothetical protein n=1 Tax=Sphaerotilus microaerophilus TaxID=2914710 RepID=UPI00207317DE|nr:hypothetical protein [Sphaerotilus sp. FB-5]